MNAEGRSLAELARSVRADALLLDAFDHEYSGPRDARSALDLVADEVALAPPVEYAGLARLAFGRPDPENTDAHARAVSQLEQLAAERNEVTVAVRSALSAVLERPAKAMPPDEGRRGNALVILAIALVVIFGVVARTLLIPVPSLAVFDRSQTAAEASLARDVLSVFEFSDEVLDSVRLIDEDVDSTFLVLLVSDPLILGTVGEGVCLYEVSADAGRAYCDLLDDVRTNGLSGFSSSSPSESFSFQWGPTGPLVINRR